VKEVLGGWEERLASRLERYPEAIIGESGLDFYHDPRSSEIQEAFLREHLRLGGLLKRPVTVHCVRSWEGLLGLFKKIPKKELPPAMLFHAYNGAASSWRNWWSWEDGFFCGDGVVRKEPTRTRGAAGALGAAAGSAAAGDGRTGFGGTGAVSHGDFEGRIGKARSEPSD
jgi:Tat protein secretion system quality control protein TatD with DNase activity